MLTRQDLQELLGFRSRHPVLSAYLHLDPTSGSSDAHKLRLRQMLKELGPSATPEAETALRYLEHGHGWTSRSLAIFSCTPEGFFRTFELEVPLRSRARFVDRPYLKPLVDLLDAYGDYGVALVDQVGVRLFHFHLGELREQEAALGRAVRHVKRGSASPFPGRRGGAAEGARHAEAVVDRNLQQSAAFAASLFQAQGVRRILLGGTDDVLAHFKPLLPKSWQSLIVGAFAIEMHAGHAQVLAKAMQVARAVEHRSKVRLVETLITLAAKGREGTVGLAATLEAIQAGRVHTLVFRDGVRCPGFRCTACRAARLSPAAGCPYCGARLESMDDVVEYAVRRVLAEGGEIEVLPTDAGADLPDGIGAQLRY